MYSVVVLAIAVTPYLAYLCYSDWRHRRLPNVWTLGGLAVVLVVRAGLDGWTGFADGAMAAGVAVLFLLLPFLVRAAGAGDLKMLAACAAFLGMGRVFAFLLYVSVAGLAVAMVLLAAHKVSAPRLIHWFRCLFDWRYDRVAGRDKLPPREDESMRVPFGIAIAIGTWAVLIVEVIK